MRSILPADTAPLLQRQRTLLSRLESLLSSFADSGDLIERLKEISAGLEDLFLVVVVGEFNSGKSSFLNTLLRTSALAVGPIPTTDRITVLRFGENPGERIVSDHVSEQTYPAELLRDVTLVDTPGTNSVIQRHQEITEEFIPRADLVLFVTSYDRPLTESERRFLEFIRDTWGKRLVFVLNKADLARGDESALQLVLDHISGVCRSSLGFEPTIFPLSAQQATDSFQSEDPAEQKRLFEASRFGDLEAFIADTLGGPDRLALKLGSPIRSARKLADTINAGVESLRETVQRDQRHLTIYNEELSTRLKDMRSNYLSYLSEVDAILLQMERQGVQFLDDSIRISRLGLLRDRDRFQETFRHQVVREHERDIEASMGAAVDGYLRDKLSLWNWTLAHFSSNTDSVSPREKHSNSFTYDRSGILDGIMKHARRNIDGHDIHGEAERIHANAKSAAALVLGSEAVAAGVGLAITILVVGAGMDVTGGFIASGILAALGFIILPHQRRKAIREFRAKMESLRADMKETLQRVIEINTDELNDVARDLVTPFEMLLSTQRERVVAADHEIAALLQAFSELEGEIADRYGSPSIVG